MAPIRVGIIGLSRSPMILGGWAANAHLPTLLALPEYYSVVAVANSTVESAVLSIAHHNLGPSVRAYGSATDIAQDPNVDLVLVCVMVDTHYELAKPALLAGKSVYVEWPLARNAAEAEELAQLAKANGAKTVVGTQVRGDAAMKKVKELIASGKIGDVVSVNLLGVLNAGVPMDKWYKGSEWYVKKESAGNLFKIGFAHLYGGFLDLFGEFSSFSSILETKYNTVELVDPSTGNIVDPLYPRTSPDHVLVQGVLKSGAIGSISTRLSNNSTVDGVGYRWLITGTEGEIEVTCPSAQIFMSPTGKKIKLTVGREGVTEEVAWDADEEHLAKVPELAKNIGAVYLAFAEGRTEDYADFEDAVLLHRSLEKYIADSDART